MNLFLPEPASLADIERARQRWTYKALCGLRQTWESWMVLTGLLAMVMIVIAFWVSLSAIWHSMFLWGGVAMGVITLLLRWNAKGLSDKNFWDDIPVDESWIMLNMLNGVPDGEAFRQAVVREGRRFTYQDYSVVYPAHNKHYWDRRDKERVQEDQSLYRPCL